VTRPRRHLLRRLLVAGGVVVLLVVGLGVWLALTAYWAKGELTVARDHARSVRTALVNGDGATAQREANLVTEQAHKAWQHTGSLPWDLAAAVPGLGQPFDSTQQISAAVDDLAQHVLQPAAQAAAALSPGSLRPAGGQVNLAALKAAQAPLERASIAARTVSGSTDAIPRGGYVAQVEDARAALQTQTHELASLLNTANVGAKLLPPMLGADGPRNYFFAFQTNTEARATGGLVGSYGILHAEQGRMSLMKLASNQLLDAVAKNPLDLGPDFQQLYGRYNSTGSWLNSNLSAHFPYAAQIWASLWQLQSGQHLDGAMATDPVALSYALGAVGPVTLSDGATVNAANVVQLAESEVYARFPDNEQRKSYQQGIATAVVNKVISGGGGHTIELLRALGKAAGEGRLDVWSARPAEQQVLAVTPLAREVPADAAPYAGLVVNNASNGKLDYYLGRTLSYTAGDCTGATRKSTVVAKLSNGAPAQGLPSYVTTQTGPGDHGPPGTNRSSVALYATAGAQIDSVTLNGAPTTAQLGKERGHPVFTVEVQLPPGAEASLQFTLTEPAAAGVAQVPVQPLVRPMTATSDVPVCKQRPR
jgi:hypothetical protein